MTKQARITPKTHEAVVRLAAETGLSHPEIIETAIEKYEREVFLQQMNEGFARLRKDAKAWREEEAERAEWDSTLNDSGHG